MSPRTLFLLGAALAAPAFLVGCDTLDNAVPDATINLPDSVGRIQLTPDGTTTTSATVNAPDNLPDGFEVTDIVIDADDVTYTPPTSAQGGGVCTVHLELFVDEATAASGHVTIDESASPFVTDFDFDVEEGYDTDELVSALQSGSFLLEFDAQTEGSCAGELTIAQITFGLGV